MNNLTMLTNALNQVAGADKQIHVIGRIGNSPIYGSLVSRIGIVEIKGVTMVVRVTQGNYEILGPMP